MLNFCTLFDSNYLSRGLAMYHSLQRCCPSFQLFILAFDDTCYDILKKMQLSGVVVISLHEFEDTDLLRIKPDRSKAEYCWTSTPSIILYVLKKHDVSSCTYLDADLFFYSSPSILLDEVGNNSVLLTEHRYSPDYDDSAVHGRYCVQFMMFKNNQQGLIALSWWRDRCIEWCYARAEDGKFGDQKYLDDWTATFEGVHVLENLGGGLAPWNIQRYDVNLSDENIRCVEKLTGKHFDPVFYHFHNIIFYNNNRIEIGNFELSNAVIKTFYEPYLNQLERMKELITTMEPSFDPHGSRGQAWDWKTPFRIAKRKIAGRYNVYRINKFIEDHHG